MMLSSFAILLVALQGIAWIQEQKIPLQDTNITFPIVASMVNGVLSAKCEQTYVRFFY